MQSLWNNESVKKLDGDPPSLGAYIANLLSEANPKSAHTCSVKSRSTDIIGEEGHALHLQDGNLSLSLNQYRLEKLSELEDLSAAEQLDQLEKSLLSDSGPAILRADCYLHATIPSPFVIQVRSAATLTLANHISAESLVEKVFAEQVRLCPPVNPGIERAKAVRSQLESGNAEALKGILVPGSGLLTFGDDASVCFEQAIALIALANGFFESQSESQEASSELNLMEVTSLRKTVSKINGQGTIAVSNTSSSAIAFSQCEFASSLGPVTDGEHEKSLPTHSPVQQAVWKGKGVFSFGPDKSVAQSLADEARQICEAYQLASTTGGLNESKTRPHSIPKLDGVLQGKIALVSGSAAGIGLATATTLAEAGACVVGADINPEIESIMKGIGALGIAIDLTDESKVKALVERIVKEFGGLDIVVSNAGIFTAGAYLEDMDQKNWDRSFAVNLTSHQVLLKHAIPFVKKGVDPTIIFIGSRNVNAPGAGAASYSCAKAGLTQLCRVAALELAPEGVRVNIIHPDAVFDTKLWTKEALERSAERYGLTVEQYKKRNLMKTEITSRSVGNTVVALASDAFAKTTGAQIPVDGGNDRII